MRPHSSQGSQRRNHPVGFCHYLLRTPSQLSSRIGIGVEGNCYPMYGIPDVSLMHNGGAVLADAIMPNSRCHTQVVDISISGSTSHWIAAHGLGPGTCGNQHAGPRRSKYFLVLVFLRYFAMC
mmetsp:Transcript_61548/g.144156  ORF Transcript_61548/g.144156 Transcript_61548/m.144156 type:complete len:123 (-) Transcript_61548:469-837(-)